MGAKINWDKLVKVLKLSTSPADGEALSAIRTANRMIQEGGITWDQVLQGKGASSQSSNFHQPAWDYVRAEQEKRAKEEAYWDSIVETCRHNVRGAAQDFIESLAHQWETKRRLSQKQKDALLKFYARF
jgi:outer membrane protein assembly factor BamE (lipoprotein component of BamABCDE complex)